MQEGSQRQAKKAVAKIGEDVEMTYWLRSKGGERGAFGVRRLVAAFALVAAALWITRLFLLDHCGS
jgi:hypothetical protein